MSLLKHLQNTIIRLNSINKYVIKYRYNQDMLFEKKEALGTESIWLQSCFVFINANSFKAFLMEYSEFYWVVSLPSSLVWLEIKHHETSIKISVFQNERWTWCIFQEVFLILESETENWWGFSEEDTEWKNQIHAQKSCESFLFLNLERGVIYIITCCVLSHYLAEQTWRYKLSRIFKTTKQYLRKA